MNYFKNIEELIVENEANKKANALRDNSSTLLTYWNIGKLIVEAQGGDARAKYGDNLISDWGRKLSVKYGKNYGVGHLYRRAETCFICYFQLRGSLWHEIELVSLSNYILPIKNANARNYYINLVILNNLSVRELRKRNKK